MNAPARRRPAHARFALLGCLLIALTALLAVPAAHAAIGGPVILGGDDMTDHGGLDSAGDPQDGWLYLQRAIENVSPKVQRPNDGFIAALGSSDSTYEYGGDAGAAIHHAAAKAGLPVQYFDGPEQMEAFFAGLQDGTLKPRIIWVAGTDSSNNLDACSDEEGGEYYALSVAQTEGQVLIDNAAAIDAFVNSGGGLISHGTCYDWLAALLPNAQAVHYESYGSNDLYFTPDGSAAFPTLTEDDINAGPWHSYFDGDLGGLKVLVRSSYLQNEAGDDVPVIIGGDGVSLTQRQTDLQVRMADDPDPVVVDGELTFALSVGNNGPVDATNVVLTDELPAGVTFVRANASQGACEGSGPVTCSLGTIAAGQTAVVTVVVRPGAAGRITNVARVTGDQPDPDASNNEARGETDIGERVVAGQRTCADNRDFTFRPHAAPGSRVVRARAWVNGKLVLDRRKRNIRRFEISGVPQAAGTIVKVIVNHSNGTKITSYRVYSECGKSVPTYKIKRRKSRSRR